MYFIYLSKNYIIILKEVLLMFEEKYVKCYEEYKYSENSSIKKLYEYNSPNLKILVAIDNSSYKSFIGGCRFVNNTPRDKAINDVCSLAKAMTRKNIIANLNYGGGKSFIYFSKLEKKEMFKIFSNFLNYLGGVYQTADDINTTVKDMEYMRNYTKYARGYMIGNYQIPATSYGVYLSIKATVKEILHKDTLDGLKIVIQGIGKVGYNLAHLLYKENCKLYISEIDKDKIDKLSKEIDFTLVDNAILADVDIICPCAFGNIINYNNVNKIKAEFIIGGANNQLEDDNIDAILYNRKIIYIPDILANCGGVIDLDCEGENYSEQYIYKRLNLIYDKTAFFLRESLKKKTSVLNVVNEYIEKEVSKKCKFVS